MATIANTGLEQVARLVAGATTSTLYWDYMALGCGTPTESAAHTALQQEMSANGGGRGLTTNYYEASYKAEWQKVFSFTGSTTINEIGLFNTMAISASTMLMRHKLASPKSVVNGDTLTVTLTCTFST